MTDLTLKTIQDSWKKAQATTKGMQDFYIKFNELTGIDIEKLKQWWMDWNKLSHVEASIIAKKHKVSLRTGGFQAFVLDQLSQDETGKVPPKLRLVE